MKKLFIILTLVVLTGVLMGASGCETEGGETTRQIQETVAKQDSIYNKNQPIPIFNYSLPKDLWTQFYAAQTTKVVRVWACEVSDYGRPISEIYECVGMPIPMDTQLTNPQKLERVYPGDSNGYIEGTIAQSEPNGLYTSPNTNATIIMVADGQGVAPVYSEHKVQAWPFPVKWDEKQGIFVRTGKASLTLDTSGVSKK